MEEHVEMKALGTGVTAALDFMESGVKPLHATLALVIMMGFV